MSLLPVAGSVCGKHHHVLGQGCEDASGRWQDESGDTVVGAVADGHGDPTCVRSAIGAQIAVDVALYELSGIAMCTRDELLELGTEPPAAADLVRGIVRAWRERVEAHLHDNPLRSEELVGVDKPLIDRWMSAHPLHLYGTTLVALLKTAETCLFVQQGDGCCMVVDEDGATYDPMPLDELCVGNVTTSLSDDDAEDRMRVCAVDVGKRHVLGCFVASDGVEKSYADTQGVGTFFQNLVIRSQSKDERGLLDELTAELQQLSEAGSGDDTSVAGVVDTGIAEEQVSAIKLTVDRFELERAAEEARERLVSMERKHAYLQRLSEAGDERGSAEFASYHAEYEMWKKRASLLQTQLEGKTTADTPQCAEDTSSGSTYPAPKSNLNQKRMTPAVLAVLVLVIVAVALLIVLIMS